MFFFKLVKPTNLAAPTYLAIINTYVKQNNFWFFLARVYGLLTAYPGSHIFSLLWSFPYQEMWDYKDAFLLWERIKYLH